MGCNINMAGLLDGAFVTYCGVPHPSFINEVKNVARKIICIVCVACKLGSWDISLIWSIETL